MTDPDERRGSGEDPREAALDALFALTFYRRGHARRPDQDRFTNWYVGVVGVVTFTAMFFSGVFGSIGPADPTDCVTFLCHNNVARRSVTTAMAVTTLGAGLWVTAAVGPIGATRERLTWLLSAPADRGVLLRSRFWSTVVAASALGSAAALTPALAATDPGTGAPPPGPLLASALTGASTGVALAAWGSILQAVGPTGPRRLRRAGATVGALGALATAAALVGVGLPGADDGAVSVLLAGTAVTVGAVAAGVARARLPGLPIAALRRGGRVTDALAEATLAMDTTPALVLAAARRGETAGRYRSRPLSGTGAAALLRADARRLLRRLAVPVTALLLLPLPPLLGLMFGEGGAIVAAGVVVAVWTRTAAAGYLAWAGSAGLRRMLGVPGNRATLALLAIPALGASGWSAAAVAVAGLPAVTVVALAACGLASALDAGQGPKPADLGVMISTPMGAVPVGLVQRVAGSLIVVASCIGPLVLFRSPLAVVVAPVVLASLVVSRRRPR